MVNSKQYLPWLCVVFLVGCCKSDISRPDLYPDAARPVKPAFTFYVVGDRVSSMHSGNFSGQLDLSSLTSYSPLYALGPLQGLEGEITIYNDQVALASVEQGAPHVTQKLEGKAMFLAYATVTDWETFTIYENLENPAAVEAYVQEAAANAGLDIEQAFPFRIETQVPTLKYHIIDRESPEQGHHDAKHYFSTEDMDIQLLGFWSSAEEQGRYTHADTRIHMHFQAVDQSTSGHVDDISIPRGARLYLPITRVSDIP